MVDIRKPLFVIPLDLGTMTTGTAQAGHGVAMLNRHRDVGLTWRTEAALSGSIWARGDMGTAKSIDFCAMLAATAQPGTTIRLRLGNTQAEVDGTAPYDSGAQAFINPAITREDGLYHSHLEIGTPQSARWWRIDISGHTGEIDIASLILGRKSEPSHFYNLDYEYGAEDMGAIEFNRFGVASEDPGIVMRTLTFTLAWQSEAEFETTFRPMLEKLGRRGIIYVCFDPSVTTYRQARTYMGVFRKSPFARGVRKPRTFAQDYQILSVI